MMEKQNIEENSVVFQLKRQLNRMLTQVDFLIRNNKLISQLDLDVMMERTRELYDILCSVKCNMDVDSIPMEIEEKTDFDFHFDINPGNEDQEVESAPAFEQPQIKGDQEVESISAFSPQPIKEEVDSVSIFEQQQIREDQEVESASIFEQQENDNIQEKVTISDVLEKQEDNSLAARLQRKPIDNLKTAIGINDKFLFVNELFNGSMEKYNKSITAMNEFKTLLGAKTYMGELQIELQWNIESEAYIKLEDLVERRFLK